MEQNFERGGERLAGDNVFPLSPAVVVSDSERLGLKLAEFQNEPLLIVELRRVIGSGRGEGGGEEAVAVYEWEPEELGIGSAIRDMEALARRHGGGNFRCQIRDERNGGWRMNQALKVARQEVQAPAAQAPGQASELAAVLATMAENARRADEKFAALMELVNKPAPGLVEQLAGLKALREAVGDVLGGASEKPKGFIEQAKDFAAAKEALGDIFGGGGGKEARGALEVVDGWITMLVPHILGDDDDETDDDDDGQDEAPAGADAAAGTGKRVLTVRQKKVKALLEKTARGLVMAVKAKLSPQKAVEFARKHSNEAEQAALVKLSADPKLSSVLVKIQPELIDHIAYIEQVRAGVLSGVAGTAGKRDEKAPGAEPEVRAIEPAAKSDGDDVGNNSKRAGGRAGDAATDGSAKKGGRA